MSRQSQDEQVALQAKQQIAYNARCEEERAANHVYRGYTIRYDPPPIPLRNCDWQWVHEDYDGPEDRRCGASGSLQAAREDIDWVEDE